MAGDIAIRRVDITDPWVQAAISEMHQECFSDRDNPYRPHQGWWWVAFDDDTAAAFAGLSESAGHEGYLCRAGVLPRYRGRGLQVRLIQARLRCARQQGFRTVVTDTRRNPASSNSLIKCGFRIFEPSHPWSFSDSIYWRKDFASSSARR